MTGRSVHIQGVTRWLVMEFMKMYLLQGLSFLVGLRGNVYGFSGTDSAIIHNTT